MTRKDDKKPDLELNALAEGLAAIHHGDIDGGTQALRFAQDLQKQREPEDRDNNRKK